MTILQALKNGRIPAMYYKGFTIIYMRGEYQANAYANPSFYNSNFSKLKKEINQYLKP